MKLKFLPFLLILSISCFSFGYIDFYNLKSPPSPQKPGPAALSIEITAATQRRVIVDEKETYIIEGLDKLQRARFVFELKKGSRYANYLVISGVGNRSTQTIIYYEQDYDQLADYLLNSNYRCPVRLNFRRYSTELIKEFMNSTTHIGSSDRYHNTWIIDSVGYSCTEKEAPSNIKPQFLWVKNSDSVERCYMFNRNMSAILNDGFPIEDNSKCGKQRYLEATPKPPPVVVVPVPAPIPAPQRPEPVGFNCEINGEDECVDDPRFLYCRWQLTPAIKYRVPDSFSGYRLITLTKCAGSNCIAELESLKRRQICR